MPATPSSAAAATAPRSPLDRVLSVDIFRGLTVAFMIIVNTPGNDRVSWLPLRHAAWHGFTPTDLVFPSFLFIIGVSAWFSSRKWVSETRGPALLKIWKRTVILFLIGMLMWYVPGFVASIFRASTGAFVKDFFVNVRILGVLGRLALCYGIGSTLALTLSRRGLIGVSGMLLLSYWAILWFFGTGSDRYSLLTNAALRFDLWAMGPAHLYHGEHVDGQPFAFDPEGLLSTLPAIVTFVIGYLTGRFLDENRDRRFAVSEMFPRALILIAAGWVWSSWLGFPINKKLWTSSYTLYVGGFSLLLLTFCVWLVDIRRRARFLSFFDVLGKNPLLAYITSEGGVVILGMIPITTVAGATLTADQWIYRSLCVPIAGDTGLASFLFSLAYMLANWVIAWIASRRGWFFRI